MTSEQLTETIEHLVMKQLHELLWELKTRKKRVLYCTCKRNKRRFMEDESEIIWIDLLVSDNKTITLYINQCRRKLCR
jgi:hypothetical protein